MKCSMCDNKKTLTTTSIVHKYKESGLDNVILHGVKQSKCEECGEVYLNFGDIDKLHALIATSLVKKADPLSGKEIRFLRKFLGFSGAVFSKLVGYEVEHLSRIENGKTAVQETFDRLVRALVMERLPDRQYKLQDLFLENKLMKLEWLEFSLSRQNEWKLTKAV